MVTWWYEIPAIKTDHSAICLELAFSDGGAPRPGYWKMNCSLLDDDDYVEAILKNDPCLGKGRS